MKKTMFAVLVLVAAVSINATIQEGVARPHGHMPSAIIYKTKADYSMYVPVTLSDDKSRIVSYPGPRDVFYQGKLATPTHLADGFLLDNRGISLNSVFIKITYEDYAKLPQAPSTDEMYNLIIDKNPFTEMYDLGPRHNFADDKAIDKAIRHHLKDYKKIL